jgi:hypothetical protein
MENRVKMFGFGLLTGLCFGTFFALLSLAIKLPPTLALKLSFVVGGALIAFFLRKPDLSTGIGMGLGVALWSIGYPIFFSLAW